MRIIFLNSFFYPRIVGGAERTLYTLVEGMLKRGHDVKVITLGTNLETKNRPSRSPTYLHYLPIKNIYFPEVSVSRTRVQKFIWHGLDIYNWFTIEGLVDAIEEFQPEVVSCHNLTGFSCSAWGAIRSCGAPVVQVLHDYYLACLTAMRSRNGISCDGVCLRCVCAKWPHKHLSKNVDGVVGISQYILEFFLARGYFPEARLARVIYNAAQSNCQSFHDDERPKILTFGFIGAIAPHKGIEVLLEAFQMISGCGNAKLLIAGTGKPDYVKSLRAKYESPNVEFLGRTDPCDFFPRLTFSVVPSLSDEPLGRVVFESLSFGVPVIGSDRGGIPEMLKDGENGYLFPAGDVLALRRILAEVSRTDQGFEKSKIAETAAKFIDVERFLNEYEQLYLDIKHQCALSRKGELPS